MYKVEYMAMCIDKWYVECYEIVYGVCMVRDRLRILEMHEMSYDMSSWLFVYVIEMVWQLSLRCKCMIRMI